MTLSCWLPRCAPLRTDRGLYRFLEPMHPAIIELREWSRLTEELSVERNRLANRFHHLLWRYYPQLLDITEDWAREWVLDLWELVPTPAKAQSIRTATVAKLLQRSRVKKWTAEALLAHLRRTPITVAPGVTTACVAHARLILARLRLVVAQMKVP